MNVVGTFQRHEKFPFQFIAPRNLDVWLPAGYPVLYMHDGQNLFDEMARHLPDPATHRLYFDFGTETLDSVYGPFQRRMDEHLRMAGYVENVSWVTHKFEGAEHSERSWRERVQIPLSFLLC